jgi:hypothetical protein
MNRRGVALLAALLGLLIAGALAALTLASARLTWLAGRRQVAAVQASLGAAGQAERARFLWDPLRAGLPVGATVSLPGAGPGPLTSRDSLARLGKVLFLIRSVATRGAADGSGLARADIRLLIRLSMPSVPESVAVASRLPALVGPAARVDGLDQAPSGWGTVCPPGAGAGLATSIDSTPLFLPGEPGQGDWVAWADRTASGVVTGIAPASAGSQCDLASASNWGDPSGGPCGEFFPVIVAQPGARLAGGAGQGLLVGLGSLELAGSFFFTGVILSQGPVSLADQAQVFGLVRSDSTVILGDQAVVQRSTCALERALMGAARPIRGAERAWWVGP